MLQDIKVRVKKIEMILVILCEAFQLGVTLHERTSAFSLCYCTNTYVNDFCRSSLFWFFSVVSFQCL